MTLFDSVQVALGQFNDFFFVSLLYQFPKKATKVNSFNITKTGLTSLFVLNTFNACSLNGIQNVKEDTSTAINTIFS